MPETITVRDVLRLLVEADAYPRDFRDIPMARYLEAQALEKASGAVTSSGDPPEFVRWIEMLRQPDPGETIREQVFSAIYDYLHPEDTEGR